MFLVGAPFSEFPVVLNTLKSLVGDFRVPSFDCSISTTVLVAHYMRYLPDTLHAHVLDMSSTEGLIEQPMEG